MKAIITVEIPKELVGEPLEIKIPNTPIMFFAEARPLPTKKQVEKRWYSEDYSFGWNACIDEILGENNEQSNVSN